MCKSLDLQLNHLEKSSAQNVSNLHNVRQIAEKMQLLPISLPVITVAGTNGKGSCVKYLEAILLAEGYRVGAFTSPHLLRYNERIRVDGADIDDESLLIAFTAVLNARDDVELSYFDYATLAVLYIFKQLDLDVILLEVGLGGRLDPVNVVDATIAVITTISMDHMDRLGNDREQIGFEKAGIMRSGHPVVCGDVDPPRSLLEHAHQLRASCYCFGKDFSCDKLADYWCWRCADVTFEQLPLGKLPLQNAATALMVIQLLQNCLSVSRRAIDVGLIKASLPGRLQIIGEKPTVLLDVAHNPESAAYLAKYITNHPPKGKVLAVFAMLRDKDITATIRPLLSVVDCWYLADLSLERGATADELAHYLQDLQVNTCYTLASVNDAFMRVLKDSAEQDMIIVFGSFYTVAEILQRRMSGGNKT